MILEKIKRRYHSPFCFKEEAVYVFKISQSFIIQNMWNDARTEFANMRFGFVYLFVLPMIW